MYFIAKSNVMTSKDAHNLDKLMWRCQKTLVTSKDAPNLDKLMWRRQKSSLILK